MLYSFIRDIPALGGSACVFIGFITFIEVLTRKFSLPAEVSRKSVHLGGGVFALFFPWLFESAISVLVLASIMIASFIFGRKAELLQCLNKVNRSSRGSEDYPLSVYFTFVLNRETPWFYVSSILVLAVADAGAALIGSKYGNHRYLVDDEYKSIEGSSVFLILAFLGISAPLLLLSELPIYESLFSAFLVALLVTAIEAISRKGRDNLFIPLAVTLILQKITTKPLLEIVYQNISLSVLTILVVIGAKGPKPLNGGASLALILFLFAAWSLGSEVWALPIIVALFLYIAISQLYKAQATLEGLRSGEVVRALLLPVLLLVTGNLTSHYDFFFGPFVLCCSVVAISFSDSSKPIAIGLLSSLLVFLSVYFIAAPNSIYYFIFCITLLGVDATYYLSHRAAQPRTALLSALSIVTIIVVLIQLFGAELWKGYSRSILLPL
jgi:dolichol kinase